MEKECLFCQIALGEVPAAVVFEDKETLAFLDIFPASKGHVLVIPKVHTENLVSASGEMLRTMISKVQMIARGVLAGMEVNDFNMEVHNGEVAGQAIEHLHFHIIPRKAGDGLEMFKRGVYKSEKEKQEVANNIKNKI